MGVDEDGDGAVVGERYLHVGTELSGLDVFAEELRETGDEFVVHRDGEVGFGGSDIAGAVALAGAGHEGELAHEENVGVGHLGDVEVHDALGVVEDAECYNLAAEVIDVVIGVGVLDAEEDEHAVADL